MHAKERAQRGHMMDGVADIGQPVGAVEVFPLSGLGCAQGFQPLAVIPHRACSLDERLRISPGAIVRVSIADGSHAAAAC